MQAADKATAKTSAGARQDTDDESSHDSSSESDDSSAPDPKTPPTKPPLVVSPGSKVKSLPNGLQLLQDHVRTKLQEAHPQAGAIPPAEPTVQRVRRNDKEKRTPYLEDASGCNSSTHRKWYAEFAREVANHKLCPVELGPSLKKDKTDIFRMWLEEGSLMRVLLRVKRKATNSTKSSDQYVWTKKRDLKYSEEKKQALIERKKNEGMWCYDPEFPKDESEIMILVLDKASYTVSDKMEESVTAEGKAKLDQESAKALLGEGGMLAAGRVAAVSHMTAVGQNKFLSSFGETKVQDQAIYMCRRVGMPRHGE